MAHTPNVPLTRPSTGDAEAAMIAEVLTSGWITGGPKVAAFEEVVGQYVGAKHAISTTSCTTALSVALYALGIGPGDEVIVPSLSFIATANAVAHVGATPVFADIDLNTYNITAESIASVMTPRTKAFMPVHQVGMPVDLDAIVGLANKHGVMVLEDAACAIGTEYKGKIIGASTTCACFSFHPRKLITTGEGGMVTTNDDALGEKVRMLCNHGASMTEMQKHAAKGPVVVGFPVVGFNYRLSDLQGACGLAQMKKLPGILARRRALAERYHAELANVAEVVLPAKPSYATPTYQSFMIRLRGASPSRRMDFLVGMKERGVACTPGVTAIHRQECYREACKGISLPNTELATDTTAIIPLFPDMTEQQQTQVINAVKSTVASLGLRAAA